MEQKSNLSNLSHVKSLEDAKRKQTHFFSSILSSIKDGISILDTNLNIIYVNKVMEEWYPHSVPLIGKKCYKAYHGRNEPCNICPTCLTLKTKKSAHETVPLTGHKGKISGWLDLYSYPFIDIETGKMIGVIEYVRDITDTKKAEESLNKTRMHYETLAEAAQDMIFIIDKEYRVQYVNEYGARQVNNTSKGLIGKNISNIFTKKTAERMKNSLKKVFTGGNPLYIPNRTQLGSKQLWLSTWLSPIKDNSGNIISVMGISRDITIHKKNEDELKKSSDYLSSILNGMYESVVVINKNGIITDVNNFFLRQHGLTRSEAVGKHCYEVMLGHSKSCRKKNPTVKCPLETVFKTGKPVNIESEHYSRSGRRISEQVYAFPLFNDKNQVEYMVEILNDVTGRVEAEQEIKRKVIQLRGTLEQTIKSLAFAIEMRDPYTAGHQRRVADLACIIGKEMGLSEERVAGIRLAGIIHDLGKLSIPAQILTKPTPLTDIEYNMIKTHPQAGYDILKSIQFPWPIAQTILQHHEKYNGSGYPAGLKGKNIILEARILAVADSLEVMSTYRPYREAMGLKKAMKEIQNNKDVLYDAAVVDTCTRLFRQKKLKV